MISRTVESFLFRTHDRLVIGDAAAIGCAIFGRKEVRAEVTRFKYYAAKAQGGDLIVEALGNTPGGVFGCAV